MTPKSMLVLVSSNNGPDQLAHLRCHKTDPWKRIITFANSLDQGIVTLIAAVDVIPEIHEKSGDIFKLMFGTDSFLWTPVNLSIDLDKAVKLMLTLGTPADVQLGSVTPQKVGHKVTRKVTRKVSHKVSGPSEPSEPEIDPTIAVIKNEQGTLAAMLAIEL